MSFAEFHLIRPYWLLALLPALTIIFLLLKNKLNRGQWSAVCDAELLPFVLQQKAIQKSRWTLSAAAIASVLVIFSLSGPTWERLPSPVFRNDAALVIALDLSRSMDASDIKPSRLDRARFKIADILKQRKDGQTSLLVYAGDAFTVTPLTEDTETIVSQLSALTTAIMPSQGSNAVLALRKAMDLLRQAGLQEGDVLLVTDAVDFEATSGVVDEMGRYRLSILGVGTLGGAPIKIAQGGFFKDSQGNIVIPKLNESELSQLAVKGKGIYQTISSDNTDIEALLNYLDVAAVEKENGKNNNLLIEQWDEKGPLLLLLVLPLIALSFRKGVLSLTFLFLLPFPEMSYALEWKDLWQTQNQQAQQAYQQKKYQQAAGQFEDSQWKAAAQYKAGKYEQAVESLENDSSGTGLYNKGNALAKLNKLTDAIDAYEKALELNPDDEDVKYNKRQVEKLLEKQKKEQSQGDSEKSESDDSEKKEDQKNGNNSESQDKQQDDENSDSEDKESKQQNPSEENQGNQQEQEKPEESEPEQKEQSQVEDASEYDESEQASEQWLKRIPDDPAGLLKRKFKYQYGSRNRQPTNNAW